MPSARHNWTRADEEALRRLYPEHDCKVIAKTLGLTEKQVAAKASAMGLKKPAEWIVQRSRERMTHTHPAVKHQFKPGLVPWNKGQPGLTGHQDGCRATQFKRGQKPNTWMPIGSTRISSDGYLQRKETATGYPPHDWVSVHKLVWQQVHGPIPAGHVVIFKHGKKITDIDLITIDQLECISRAENMLRNSVHRHGPEIAHVCQLRGVINRMIRNTEIQQQEPST